MCPKSTSAQKNKSAEIKKSSRSVVAMSLGYTLPVLRETKTDWYIEFYAYDPEIGKMRRKRIKVNRIKGVVNRRNYVRDAITRLYDKLRKGWNPWIAGSVQDLPEISDAFDRYEDHILKMVTSGYYAKETYAGYRSSMNILRQYINNIKSVHYVYQFDKKFCIDFLDYIFIERNNGAQTRNNYLNFLRVLSGFLVEKGYLNSKPTDGIAPISKRLYKKERTCIPLEQVGRIAEYCMEFDKHFLLACYLVYYCFIRPVELTRLRIRDFNLQAGTITIPADCSKNKKRQTITVPKKVLHYAIDLGIFSQAMDDYIFSIRLQPGSVEIDTKILRDHWGKLSKSLKFRKEWKFYSLKDTGITAMLRDNMPAIDVRDQARHSSLDITEIYTDHRDKANLEISRIDGAL